MAECSKGHAMTPENTYTYRGVDRCVECRRDTRKRYREKKRRNDIAMGAVGPRLVPPAVEPERTLTINVGAVEVDADMVLAAFYGDATWSTVQTTARRMAVRPASLTRQLVIDGLARLNGERECVELPPSVVRGFIDALKASAGCDADAVALTETLSGAYDGLMTPEERALMAGAS